MGFKAVQKLLVDALTSGRYQHEERADIETKNLLAAGDVTTDFVVRLIQMCKGPQYKASKHHWDDSIICHEFKPEVSGERWYVKAYFISADATFISVHP